jgi:hypothetical protein
MAKRLITIVTTSLALLASTAALAGTAYTRIANNGAELDDTVTALGTGPLDWACTRDNATGLVWEVKTNDTTPGLRDQTKTYTNLDDATQAQFWVGGTHVNPTQAQIDAGTNSIGFAAAVNGTALCGYADWRRPSKDELLGLPRINQTYFPNTSSYGPGSFFWSDSPHPFGSGYAWGVYYGSGDASYDGRRNSDGNAVRLVRGGQSLALWGLSVGTTGSGAGRVSNSGVSCTREGGASYGTCWSPRASNESVALIATPADGSAFTGWGGACSGTEAACALYMNAAKSVTASFAAAPAAVTQIVLDPTTPTTLYSALPGNGVYKKTASADWTAINTGLSNLSVKALAIKPDASRLFAGTDGGGVFYGDGSSWTACANTGGGMSSLYVRSLTVSGSTLYAGTSAGVFVSTDGCANWAAMNTGLPL